MKGVLEFAAFAILLATAVVGIDPYLKKMGYYTDIEKNINSQEIQRTIASLQEEIADNEELVNTIKAPLKAMGPNNYEKAFEIAKEYNPPPALQKPVKSSNYWQVHYMSYDVMAEEIQLRLNHAGIELTNDEMMNLLCTKGFLSKCLDTAANNNMGTYSKKFMGKKINNKKLAKERKAEFAKIFSIKFLTCKNFYEHTCVELGKYATEMAPRQRIAFLKFVGEKCDEGWKPACVGRANYYYSRYKVSKEDYRKALVFSKKLCTDHKECGAYSELSRVADNKRMPADI